MVEKRDKDCYTFDDTGLDDIDTYIKNICKNTNENIEKISDVPDFLKEYVKKKK